MSLRTAMVASGPLCVIDGANIGHFNTIKGVRNQKHFSSHRLLQAVAAVREWGMRPHILLPQKFISSRNSHNHAKDVDSLLSLEKKNLLSRLPSHIDDDNPIIDLAIERNAFILTNDGFIDHLSSGKISHEFTQSNVFKCYELDSQLKLVPPVHCRLKRPAPPTPTTSPVATPATAKSTKSTKSTKQQHHHHHNQQQLIDRIQQLETENHDLQQENKTYVALERVCMSETSLEFTEAFDVVESFVHERLFCHDLDMASKEEDTFFYKLKKIASTKSSSHEFKTVEPRYRALMHMYLQRKEVQEANRQEQDKRMAEEEQKRLKDDERRKKEQDAIELDSMSKRIQMRQQHAQHFHLTPSSLLQQQQAEQQREQQGEQQREQQALTPMKLLRRPAPKQSQEVVAIHSLIKHGNKKSAKQKHGKRTKATTKASASISTNASAVTSTSSPMASASISNYNYEDALQKALVESAKEREAQLKEQEEYERAMAASVSDASAGRGGYLSNSGW